MFWEAPAPVALWSLFKIHSIFERCLNNLFMRCSCNSARTYSWVDMCIHNRFPTCGQQHGVISTEPYDSKNGLFRMTNTQSCNSTTKPICRFRAEFQIYFHAREAAWIQSRPSCHNRSIGQNKGYRGWRGLGVGECGAGCNELDGFAAAPLAPLALAAVNENGVSAWKLCSSVTCSHINQKWSVENFPQRPICKEATFVFLFLFENTVLEVEGSKRGGQCTLKPQAEHSRGRCSAQWRGKTTTCSSLISERTCTYPQVARCSCTYLISSLPSQLLCMWSDYVFMYIDSSVCVCMTFFFFLPPLIVLSIQWHCSARIL